MNSQAMNQTIFKNILLLLDGVDTSMAAAQYAVKMSAELGSNVVALYVVDTPTMDYLLKEHVLLKEERDSMENELADSAENFLRYVAELARENGAVFSCRSCKGHLSHAGLQTARETGADAILMGNCHSSSRHDLSTMERQLILTESACPVIVVR
jgi:nucleotide-binding universal stress UspA family protein